MKVYKSIQGLFWTSFSHQRILKMPKNWVSSLSFEVFSLCFEGFSCVFSYFLEFKVLLLCFFVATVEKLVTAILNNLVRRDMLVWWYVFREYNFFKKMPKIWVFSLSFSFFLEFWVFFAWQKKAWYKHILKQLKTYQTK